MTQAGKILTKIINAVSVDEEHNVFHLNKPVGRATKDSNKNNSVINDLAEIIYSNYYITGGVPGNNKLKPKPGKNKLPNALNFTNELKRAYTLNRSLDNGWNAVERDSNGTIYAQKYDEIIQLRPGQFIWKENRNGNYYGKNLSPYIPELKQPGLEYFYFVRANVPFDSVNAQLARFYFNLHPKGAPLAIKEITAEFNEFGIPFLFKCSGNPSNFRRTDNSVLYIENCYVNISLQLLRKIVSHLKPFLKTTVPLFALKLFNGFSFAENPTDGNSFGMNRSLLIADGIAEAIHKKRNKKLWLSFMLKHINKSGYSVNEMYRNPGPAYPYDFSMFTDEK
ncbi:MAG: T3SS effector HopA1 family protein [Bacteroidia bacterium]